MHGLGGQGIRCVGSTDDNLVKSRGRTDDGREGARRDRKDLPGSRTKWNSGIGIGNPAVAKNRMHCREIAADVRPVSRKLPPHRGARP